MGNRMLKILQLFRQHPEPWTVEALAQELGVSASSAYRDVQELSGSGFLDPVNRAGYVLGPAFIEYDRLIRQNDRLVQSAAGEMQALLARTTQTATAILCRRYRETVICVHQERGSGPNLVTAYERGVAMPLFAGASSKAILAQMDDRTLKRVYLEHEDAIRRTGVEGWADFRNALRTIRRERVVVTRSEVTKGRVGIAAPVFIDRQVAGGISLVLNEDAWAASHPERLPGEVLRSADAISASMASHDSWIPR